jgi:predicted MPP superfamily phosphohydrolase
VFVVPLLFMGLVLIWLAHRLVWVPGWRSRWFKVGVPVVLVVLTGLAFLQFGSGARFVHPDTARPAVWVGAVWLSVLFYLMLVLIPAALILWLLGWTRRSRRREFRRASHRVVVPLALITALAVSAYGLLEAAHPELTPHVVTSPDLPEVFDGTTVAVITDLHAGPVLDADFTRRVVDLVNDAEPDLVLLAGDVVDGPEWRYGSTIDPLRDLEAPLGVFAVTGNHELYTETVPAWEQRLRVLGIETISNTSVLIERGGQRMWLAGLRDASGTGDLAPDHEAAVADVQPDDFTLLMAHQPRSALEMPEGMVDLQVSGHTHGGQLWPVRPLVLLQQPMVDGLARINGIDVVTSRGAGNWGPPVRVAAPPEVPLITLRRG